MISFIVPAHNEEAVLPGTLAAIGTAMAARAEAHEVIVVDDSSTDRTGEIARNSGATVVRVEHRQISRTRNSGAAAASGDVFIFLDADTHVNARAVEAAVGGLRADPGAVAVSSPVEFEGRVPLWLRLLLPAIMLMFRIVKVVPGCFFVCRAPAFRRAGGFDETLFAGEEVILSRNLRRLGRIVLNREPVVTSGRKGRTHSAGEILWIFLLGAVLRERVLRDRSRLGVWYGERRPDPGDIV